MPFYQMLCITTHYQEYVCILFIPLCEQVNKLFLNSETHKRTGSSDGDACNERRRRRPQYQLVGYTHATTTHEEAWRNSLHRRVRVLQYIFRKKTDGSLPLKLLDHALRHSAAHTPLTKLDYATRPTCHSMDGTQTGL